MTMIAREREIQRAVSLIVECSSVAELRVLHTKQGTRSGYFDDQDRLVEAARAFSGKAPGVYVTLNPIRPELLARAANRLVPYAKSTTADKDILCRRWLLIDFDPVRPSGISSRDAEREAAVIRAKQCRDYLRYQGWPDPIFADSGNGAHLLFRIQLPNDDPSRDLVKRCLEPLAIRFNDQAVVIDPATYNAARICKVYGTLSAKGDNTPDRPHRIAQILEAPEALQVVSYELLFGLAATVPKSTNPQTRRRSEFDVRRWLDEHGIPVVSEANWNDGRKFILNPCPFNPGHTDCSAYVVQLSNGAIAAGCLHNSCAGENWPSLRGRFDPKFRSDRPQSSSEAATEDWSNGKKKKMKHVERLIALAQDAELFHTPDDQAYATVSVGDHQETWPLKSKKFRQWLLRRYYLETQSAPTGQVVQEALTVLESKAHFDGPELLVWTRIAEAGDKIYIDLVSEKWEAIEVDVDGWRIIAQPPVKFRRARGMMALPQPVRGGQIEDLRKFLNIDNDAAFVLVVSWLLAALRPYGPYPIAVFHGEQGSCKSTLTKVLRLLVDPNTAVLRAEPRDVRDLMIAASNACVVALDNLSHIPAWLSDALCRLSTGGGFGTRELYTDTEEILFQAQRPAILNGIEELATRGDLLDRCIVIYLPAITEDRRRPEREFWADFDTAAPGILGVLLDAVAIGLRRLPEIKLTRFPRLADFALWVVAAEPALGWPNGTFLDAYAWNRISANDLALDASLITASLRSLAASGAFEGTASDLLRELGDRADDITKKQRGWPKNARALTGALRRLAPNLRAAGIEVQFWREANKIRRRMISVREFASTSSGSSKTASAETDVRTQADATFLPLDDNGGVSDQDESLKPDDSNHQLNGVDDAEGKFPILPLGANRDDTSGDRIKEVL